ncbi:hypothetical protein [Micromonospora matsumotoense]|nr:hypothetical protein [Micromonospora matsumotoense]
MFLQVEVMLIVAGRVLCAPFVGQSLDPLWIAENVEFFDRPVG